MNASDQLQIEFLPIDTLLAFSSNARTHSKKQIHQILASINEFGFTNPIIIDDQNRIICGHGRVEAAKLAKYSTVPSVRLSHLSDEQKRAYVIADNKIALNSGWDSEILATELQHLSVADLNFDLELTGFSTEEIDNLLDHSTQESRDEELIPHLELSAVTKNGDVWALGHHRLACSDARDPEIYSVLLDQPARMVFADPPYNVPVHGHARNENSVHREFKMASGELPPAEFIRFLNITFKNCVDASLNGAIHYIAMDWRHVNEIEQMAKDIYSELKNICVWNKTNAGMGSFYRSKHEFIFVFKVGDAPHLNNIDLGRNGRYRTNVWDYTSPIRARTSDKDLIDEHPTVKPVALVMDAIKDCTRRGEIVLDPFSGSGTTIIAAEKAKRHARAIEIDPLYVDLALRRWKMLTGCEPVLESDGRSFFEVAASRQSHPDEGGQDSNG